MIAKSVNRRAPRRARNVGFEYQQRCVLAAIIERFVVHFLLQISPATGLRA
jgi:hypothetical protein